MNDIHVSWKLFCAWQTGSIDTASPAFLFRYISGYLGDVHGDNVVKYLRDIIDLLIIQNNVSPIFVHTGDGAPALTGQVLNLSHPVFSKVRDLRAEQDEYHSRHGFRGCIRCSP